MRHWGRSIIVVFVVWGGTVFCGKSSQNQNLSTLKLLNSLPVHSALPWGFTLVEEIGEQRVAACGGTYISSGLLLTAAHCVLEPSQVPGERYRYRDHLVVYYCRHSRCAKVQIVHVQRVGKGSDLALLVFNESALFSELGAQNIVYPKPIELAQRFSEKRSLVRVYGTGAIRFSHYVNDCDFENRTLPEVVTIAPDLTGHPDREHLQRFRLRFYRTFDDCLRLITYKDSEFDKDYISLSSTEIHSVDSHPAGQTLLKQVIRHGDVDAHDYNRFFIIDLKRGQATCSGDSGSAVTTEEDGQEVLVGVVTNGFIFGSTASGDFPFKVLTYLTDGTVVMGLSPNMPCNNLLTIPSIPSFYKDIQALIRRSLAYRVHKAQ